MRRLFLAAILGVATWLLPLGAAQANRCLAYVERMPGVVPVRLAALSDAPVEIRYVMHSTFRLRSPAGVIVATDYAGYAGDGPAPTAVTMNHAHDTHFTDMPDPAIRHVLRGWNPGGGPARHRLRIEDVLIRNVPTDIRSWVGGVEPFGNSIFIFEVADLCIGHLGHLHHKPTPEQFALIGRLDIVFAAVDGGLTLDLPSMIAVLKQLRASLVIPMHFFARSTLDQFLAGMQGDFAILRQESPTITVSLGTLPKRPAVLVLGGY